MWTDPATCECVWLVIGVVCVCVYVGWVMLYLYVGEHIKPKQPCGETCFIQQRSPLFLSLIHI